MRRAINIILPLALIGFGVYWTWLLLAPPRVEATPKNQIPDLLNAFWRKLGSPPSKCRFGHSRSLIAHLSSPSRSFSWTPIV